VTRIINLISIVLVMLMSIVSSNLPGRSRQLKIHPLLLQLASDEPYREVQVIVQKSGSGGSVEVLVDQLGGEITGDLSLINAFAAQMTAGAAVELATSPSVKWISPDAGLEENTISETADITHPASAFIETIGADRLWNGSPSLHGNGITVAVVDSGIAVHADLDRKGKWNQPDRVVARSAGPGDRFGHGTHVAGIIAGNGRRSDGDYMGVAPQADLANVHVTHIQGGARTSEVIHGLQWILNNKDEFGIRVVNLSLNSTVEESYHTSPLDAALEVLWFNGIVVVVSAGNQGEEGLYPPANDPFVITVGALDDQGTGDPADDVMASYSAYGVTLEGFNKPDILAPGSHIISLQAKQSCILCRQHPDHRVGKYYFSMSGTSMAAAVTAGAAALLLQDEPDLSPDQVKFRLIETARPSANGIEAGSLDVYAAVHADTTATANTGVTTSQLLWTGSDPINWESVNWGSVNWGSVNWGSVNWGSVNWGSDYWEP
jgi:serine protease AprX